MKSLLFALTLTLLLGAACTPTTPTPGTTATPVIDKDAAGRAVLAAEGKYRLALIVAEKYVNLPLCDKSPPPCATLTVVRVIQKAQPAARAALDAAEQTVKTDGFGDNVYSSAADAALYGIKALEDITATLK